MESRMVSLIATISVIIALAVGVRFTYAAYTFADDVSVKFDTRYTTGSAASAQ